MEKTRKSSIPQESFCEQPDLKFFFVLTDDVEDDDDMNVVCSMVKDYFPKEDDVQWIKGDECLRIKKSGLTKKDVFVFKTFECEAFNFLHGTKLMCYRLLGPQRLKLCINEDKPIPYGANFSSAMKNLTICASGFTKPEKNKLSQLVQWMGGTYSDNLGVAHTHLVTNTVQSAKYEVAAKMNIHIMQSSWIEEVWKKTQSDVVAADDFCFNVHKVPIFYGLILCSTGLKKDVRIKCEKLLNENGGELLGSFHSQSTAILLVNRDNTDSEKFRAADSSNIDCLTPDWVIDSVAAGYALPTTNYKVSAIKVSTPNKDIPGNIVTPTDFNADFSIISNISRVSKNSDPVHLSETMSTTIRSTRSSGRNNPEPAYRNVLKKIEVRLAQKAGSFLDGCNIFLSGFKDVDKEKLNRILNGGGAIRFDELNDRVTHVLVGEPVPTDFDVITINNYSPSILQLDWLFESINLKQTAPEAKFIFRKSLPISKVTEMPSPASKKNLEKMSSSFKRPANIPKFKLNDVTTSTTTTESKTNDENEHLLSQYMEKNSSTIPKAQPKMTESEYTQTETDFCDLLIGKRVSIYQHSDDFYDSIMNLLIETRAEIVDQNKEEEVDFLIVPFDVGLENEVKVKAKEIVNEYWMVDNVQQNEVQDIQYFHRAMPNVKKLLKTVNIVLSTYTGTEREFLFRMCQAMGANNHEQYVRNKKPLLVCPSAEGQKYNAALKWQYSVVTKDWLLKCYEMGRIVHVTPFLVGVSTPTMFDEMGICSDQPEISCNDIDMSEMSHLENPVKESTRLHSASVAGNSGKPSRRATGLQTSTATGILVEEKVQLQSFVEKRKAKTAPVNDPQTPNDSSRSGITAFNRSILDAGTPRKTDSQTPMIHKQVRSLKGKGKHDKLSSPETPPVRKRIQMSPITPADPDENLKFLSPCAQEIVREVMKEYEDKDTPNTKKLKKLLETPGTRKSPPTPKIPANAFSPPLIEKTIMGLPKNPPRPDNLEYTPIGEKRRRIFKKLLGDEYQSPKNEKLQPEDAYDSDDPIWEDFKEIGYVKKQREKTALEKLNEASEEYFRNFKVNQAKTTNEVRWYDSQSQTANVAPQKPIPCFNISCTDDQQKKKIIEQIIQLNGTVCQDLVNYDASCTHIVCEIPNRSEKIFGAIAAGKWVLSLNYIADSVAQGYFLDEEAYEWGNPNATKNPKISEDTSYCGNAAYRWRKKLSQDCVNKGAFSEFAVILNVNKREQFTRLIEAGGGIVLNNPTFPLSEGDSLSGITHCFVDAKRSKISAEDRAKFDGVKIPIVSVMYLNAMLVNEKTVDVKEYLVK